MAFAGLTFGIMAVTFAFPPFLFLSFLFLPVGLSLSTLALIRNTERGQGFVLAFAGIALHFIAFAHVWFWMGPRETLFDYIETLLDYMNALLG